MLREHGIYIDEARRRLYRTVVVFTVVFVSSFFMAGPTVGVLIRLLNLERATIVATSPFQFFDLAMDIAFFFALFVSLPYGIWNVFQFLRPAVSPFEFKILIGTIPICFALFIGGMVYGFYVLYWTLDVAASVNASLGLENMWDVGLFFSQVTLTALFLGVLFQFPLILNALMRSGLVSRQFFVNKRRLVYVIILIMVSFLPPTDGISLMIMSMPLVMLYEGTLLLNRSKKSFLSSVES